MRTPDDTVRPFVDCRPGDSFPNASSGFLVSYFRGSGDMITEKREQRGSTAVERRCGKRRRNACNPPSSSYEDRWFGVFNQFKTQNNPHFGTVEGRGLRRVSNAWTHSAPHGNHSRRSTKPCSQVQANSSS